MSIITSAFATVSVPAGHCVLEYRRGRLSRTLTPGQYRRRRTATHTWLDMRARVISVAPQEILTAEGVSVRVTVALRATITDPVAFVEQSNDPWSAIYLSAQVALRDACASVSLESLMARGDAVDMGVVLAAARTVGATVGVTVAEALLKDVIVPSEIRSAATELISAKARGLAKLETARAETAALRSLANAGRVLDAHPALAQLRLVQEAPYGTRLVLSVGDAAQVGDSAAAPVADDD